MRPYTTFLKACGSTAVLSAHLVFGVMHLLGGGPLVWHESHALAFATSLMFTVLFGILSADLWTRWREEAYRIRRRSNKQLNRIAHK